MQRLGADWDAAQGVAVHRSALVEPGAVLKPPAIIGPNGFIAAGACLRSGVWLDEDCIVGPSCELKSTFMFKGSKIAHLSFVGDSVIGADVNIEAGAMIANYRNELSEKRIRIEFDGTIIDTGVDKFGALVGDGARIGTNAVIAPGALIRTGALSRGSRSSISRRPDQRMTLASWIGRSVFEKSAPLKRIGTSSS